MPPLASTTAFALKTRNRPRSRSYPKAPTTRSPSIRSSTTVHSMCTSIPWWMPWSCKVRIISSPVRSPTWASRGYLWPPKFRCRIRPSAVRSNTAPQASSSRTRSGACCACSSAIRQLLRYCPTRQPAPGADRDADRAAQAGVSTVGRTQDPRAPAAPLPGLVTDPSKSSRRWPVRRKALPQRSYGHTSSRPRRVNPRAAQTVKLDPTTRVS